MIISSRLFLRLLLASVLLTVVLPACEITRRNASEFSSPGKGTGEIARRQESTSKIVASIGEENLIKYLVPRDQLAQAFNRQFGDGTSISKTMVRKVQGGPKDPASYFLVGLGLRNGMFRGMAVPLTLASGSELLLRSNATRYIITGVSCNFCYFNFESNEIVGTSCEESAGGSNCNLRMESNNTMFSQ